MFDLNIDDVNEFYKLYIIILFNQWKIVFQFNRVYERLYYRFQDKGR